MVCPPPLPSPAQFLLASLSVSGSVSFFTWLYPSPQSLSQWLSVEVRLSLSISHPAPYFRPPYSLSLSHSLSIFLSLSLSFLLKETKNLLLFLSLSLPLSRLCPSLFCAVEIMTIIYSMAKYSSLLIQSLENIMV